MGRKLELAIWVLAAIAVAGALLLGVHAVRAMKADAQRTRSVANLHCWGSALRFYASEHNAYPASLSDLYEGGLVASCPGPTDPCDESPPPPDENGRRWSYVYVGPLPADVPDWTIIAYTRPGMQPGERLVLYADKGCTAEWVDEQELLGLGGGSGRKQSWFGSRRPASPRCTFQASYRGVVRTLGDALTPERNAELQRFYEIGD